MKVSKEKKSELFDLIKSLSVPEKRYLKLFASMNGKHSNYYQVFKAIEQQETYDEKAIKEQFFDKPFIRQFHVMKNYLKDLILKSLRNFHNQSSKNAEVKDILRNIEILNNKELYGLMDSELKRAQRIAMEFELLESLVEIMDWRRRLGQSLNPQDHAVVKSITEEQEEVLKKIQNRLTYYKLIADLASSIYSDMNLVNDTTILRDINNAQTFESRILHYNAVYFKEILDNRGEMGVKSLSHFTEFMELFPKRLMESPGMYASTVNNLISYEIFNRNYDKALERISRLKEIYDSLKAGKKTKSFFRHISRTYNLELEVIRDSEDIMNDVDNVLEIENFVKVNKNLLPLDYLSSFRFQLASIFFRLEDYDRALQWTNELLEIKDATRLDMLLHARFLNLMIHYEKSNVFVLRYFVDSTRRFLKKHNLSAAFYELLLRFFSRIGKAPVFEHKQYFTDLLQRFVQLEEENSFPSADLDYVNYKSWVFSKIS